MNHQPGSQPRTEALAGQVAELAACLAREPSVLSVVLVGSVARSEEAYATIGPRHELLSDVELVAVTGHRLAPVRRRALAADLDQVARRFGYTNPLFHVEVLFRQRSRLRRMPPFIFTYELAANGRTLAGTALQSELPRLRPVDLDRRNAHEILMKRLWSLAEHVPRSLVEAAPMTEMEQVVLAAVLARQPLDVPTALLPDAGILRPTYGERLQAWRQRPDLPFRRHLDESLGFDTAGFLEWCLALRRDVVPLEDALRTYDQVLRLLAASIGWLVGSDAAGAAAAIARRSRLAFNERPITGGEWLALARQFAAMSHRRGPREACRWALRPRKGHLTAGLLHLHAALIAHLSGGADQAHEALGELFRAAGRPEPSSSDAAFAARWGQARMLLGRQFWRTVRLGDPDAWQRLVKSIEWP